MLEYHYNKHMLNYFNKPRLLCTNLILYVICMQLEDDGG